MSAFVCRILRFRCTVKLSSLERWYPVDRLELGEIPSQCFTSFDFFFFIALIFLKKLKKMEERRGGGKGARLSLSLSLSLFFSLSLFLSIYLSI